MLFLNTPHSPQGPFRNGGRWVLRSCNIRCLFWKCMFTNIIFHLCQSDCLYRFQLYMFCALCITSGGNYKRYRLSVRLAGVFDSRVSVNFENVYSQTTFHIFVNQIVYINAKCTCFAHFMLHQAISLGDFISQFQAVFARWRHASTGLQDSQ